MHVCAYVCDSLLILTLKAEQRPRFWVDVTGTEWSRLWICRCVLVDQESIGGSGSANWVTPALVNWRNGTGVGHAIHVFVSDVGVYMSARTSRALCLCTVCMSTYIFGGRAQSWCCLDIQN